MLPEISLKNSLNNYDNTNNNNNRIENNSENQNYSNNLNSNFAPNQAKEDKFPLNSGLNKNKNLIENIKEKNENVETINLTTENQRDNQLIFNFNISKEEDSENGDDKMNTNLYCLTNSNIENKFYSSILETNDFFKNQKTEKDGNLTNNNTNNI